MKKLSFTAAVLAPAVALACPMCAERADGKLATYLLVAALLAVPYTLGAVVVRIVKNLE